MDNSLWLYMNKRLGKKEESLVPEDLIPGPVLTISREVGCGGLKTARKLANLFNKTEGQERWRVFSKEVFEKSARELNMDQQKVRKILKAEERNTFDEILAAFGDKRFKSERIIKKTAFEVIKSIAIDGHCIIVGRGGHLITKDIERALHIRLSAPLNYRIKQIAQNHQSTESEAKVFIEKTEKERENFRKHFGAGKIHDRQFDLVINVNSFLEEEVIQFIENAMKIKKLVKAKTKILV